MKFRTRARLRFYCTFSVSCWAATSTYGQSAPYDPGFSGTVIAGGNSCGLVETTYTDIDWVLATSDRIFRSNLCLASDPCDPMAWYDRVFNPCYAENRYWKLPPDSGSAFAYTMSALGVGSFDSLYVRSNVKFQLYSGSGDDIPFGPPMTGPKYISITYWRDVNPACDGFEAGTVFVDGGPGALGNYSIKIGEDVEILEVDAQEDKNKKDHHTDKFVDDFVLRRSASFEVIVKVSRDYGPGCHEIYFEAKHTFDGPEVTIAVPEHATAVPAGQWGAQRLEVKTNGDGTKSVKLNVQIGDTAGAGTHEFKCLVRDRGETTPDSEKDFTDPIGIVFNPWSTTDAVHLGSGASRDEYILNESGRMWRGSVASNSPKDWRFAQFDTKVFEATLKLLDGVGAAQRADPIFVARHLSALVNSNDGSGVLTGNWSGSYGGGTSPSGWSGSDDILKQYLTSGSDVKWGQCWVFGGVLTTCARSLGIPARPLSNFESGHDTNSPSDKTIDRYWKQRVGLGGVVTWESDDVRTNDSIWNYHVWCDAWINGGWNAIDATPQETSGGVHRLGPAPHSSILANSGGSFDVDFVVAEVDADIKDWLSTPDGMGGFTDVLHATDTTQVGQTITTKAVVGGGASDITSAYKAAPRPPERPSPVILPISNIEITFDPPAIVPLGDDVPWSIVIRNTGTVEQTVYVLMKGKAIAYDGTNLGGIGETEVLPMIAAGGQVTVDLLVPLTTYVAFTAATRTLSISVGLQVVATTETFLDEKRTLLIEPAIALSLAPLSPIPVGGTVLATADYQNPLAINLTNAVASFVVGTGLSIVGAADIPLGLVGPGQPISLSKQLTGAQRGTHLAAVSLTSDELSDVWGYVYVEVFTDCNANGLDDLVETEPPGTMDCNDNDVPDECDPDCDNNDVPDECQIEMNELLDCNANRALDGCDILSGSSPDIDLNGIPDECGADCNRNGVLDSVDLDTGMSMDCSGNLIPDECEPDCNANGVADSCEPDCNSSGSPDACDIALGLSMDCNADLVPNECEADCNASTVPDVCELNPWVMAADRPALLGFIDISTGGLAFNLSDDSAVIVTIPFTNELLPDSNVVVSNNGSMAVTGLLALGAVNGPIPNAQAFGGAGAFFPYWDDLDATTGNVFGSVVGTAPDRALIIQWHDRPQYPGNFVLDGDEITFQLQVYERPINDVGAQFVYLDTTFGDPAFDDGASASIGFQLSGLIGTSWSVNQAGSVNANTVLSLVRCEGPQCDHNGNGMLDECEVLSVQSSDPPNGAIDARQPFELDGSNADGWMGLDMDFLGDISALLPGMFSVSQVGGIMTPPTVADIQAFDPSTVRLTLDRILEVETRTTITFIPASNVIALGFLPGDIDGDGVVGSEDLEILVACVAGTTTRPDYSTDVDRSGTLGGSDLIRAADLLNGAGSYKPYRGAVLP